MKAREVSILCSLKVHSWYSDSGWFNTVERCRRCGQPKDRNTAKKLAEERQLWDQVPSGYTMFQQIRWVKERLDKDA